MATQRYFWLCGHLTLEKQRSVDTHTGGKKIHCPICLDDKLIE